MTALSWAEHAACPRPSILLKCYLFVSLIFNIAQARTVTLAASSQTWHAHLFTAAVALKGLAVILEAQHKTRWLL